MKMSTEVLESVINESIEQVIAEQKEAIDDETVDLTPVGEFDPDKEQDFANDKNDEISDETKIDDDSTDSTEEKVEEMVENKVEEYPDMTFLGLDITINKKEDSDTYVVKVSDLDSDVSEEFDLESVNLQGILGIVEDFFNKLQLNFESSDEDISDKDKTEDTDIDISDNETDNTESKNKDEEDEEAMLSSLRVKYSDRLDNLINIGLEAKQITLDLIKNEILANNIAELSDKVKNLDSLIASKKKELDEISKTYVLASKKNKDYDKVYNTIISNTKKLKSNVLAGKISSEESEEIMKKYKIIISSVLTENDKQPIIANVVDQINKISLVSSVKQNTKNNKVNIVDEQEKTNILNASSISNSKSSLLADVRYDGIDEMSAEILRL